MKIIQEAIDRVGIKSLLNHGAGSLVWSEGVEGVTQDDLLAYTREVALHCAVALAAPQPNAALADGWKRKPLTLAQMEAGRESIFSTSNPFCPCDSKTFRKVAEWVERHHRIAAAPPTLNASKEQQP